MAHFWVLILQALFRKIAAALPGMESLSATKQEDLVDINLAPSSQQNKAGDGQAASQACACWFILLFRCTLDEWFEMKSCFASYNMCAEI